MGDKLFKGKKVMVTGGTGSFGHVVMKRLLEQEPQELRVFSRDEDKQDRMKYEFKEYEKSLRFVLGDVRNKQSLIKGMRGVDVVFHAAALKQVPPLEVNPWEGAQTNVMGAQNIVEAALELDIPKVVAISTDKAVEPVNAYGMSKALQEKLIIAGNVYKDGRKTVFSCVRYGNVLGSRGSIVPLFKKQITEGKAITLTHKDMTRFALTLDQAIDLVFLAYKDSAGGEIFVLKNPGHTVTDLAEVMLKELDAKNKKIETIGIRPGEKVHETLISPTESLKTVERKDHYIVLPQVEIAEISKKYPGFWNEKMFRFSSDTTRRLNKDEIKKLLKSAGWL